MAHLPETAPRAGERGRRRDIVIWWGPRALFVLGAVALIIEAARGVPLPRLWLALGFFIACSLAFVVRQLVRGHEKTPECEAPRWLILAGTVLCAAGLAVAVVYFAGVKVDALPLIGSVLFLLGLGWLVEAWREARPGPHGAALLPMGAACLGLAVVSAVTTAVVLARSTGRSVAVPLACLAIALFVVLPVGLNLLSEWGLRLLRGRQGARPSTPQLCGLAVLAAVGSFVVWLAFHDWGLIAIAVGTALILLLAIVSNTHADVALVLAGLCLLGTAPPERPLPPTLDPRGGSRVLVAIGDSYMSGEGAASYYAGTDDAGGNQCRRAPTAYAVGLATRESRFDRVLFLACSGARTYNVVRGSDERRYAAVQTGEPGTQIDQLHSRGPSLRPALVIVGLGGNDAGFAMIGEACLAPGDCDTQRLLFVHNLAKVERALVEVYRSLLASLPAGVPVVAVPYPQPIADARRCSGVALSKRERDFVREFVDLLDARVESAARAAGVHYLAEMKHALAVHRVQLCDRRKHAAGVNFVDIASVNGLASQRFSPARWLHNSLHPNERGHDAMRRTLGAWLDAHPEVLAKGSMPEPGAGDVPASALRGSVAAPAPPCGVTDGATTNCRAQVRQWELQQILGLWPSALAVLLGLVVVWLMSIAVISLHPGDGTHRTP